MYITENKRLKEIQVLLGFKSQSEFASVLGIKQGSLSDIYREKQGVKVSDGIKRVLEKEYSINIEWLETGEGEMLRKNAETLPSSNKDKISKLNEMIANIQQKEKRIDQIRFIPLLSIDAVGGTDNDVADSPEYIEGLIPVNGAKEKSICIPVSGDSMMPIFNPGDYVVIDEVVEWNLFLEMGQYYVVALKDNRRLIKKVTYSEIDKNSNFLLVSVNENYPPVELPKSLIRRVFIVTQKHQKLTL